jgi:hypothetical protein
MATGIFLVDTAALEDEQCGLELSGASTVITPNRHRYVSARTVEKERLARAVDTMVSSLLEILPLEKDGSSNSTFAYKLRG